MMRTALLPVGEAPASSPTTEPSRTRDEPTPVGLSPEPRCARVSTESSDLEDIFLSRKLPTVPVAPPLLTEDSITKLSRPPSQGTILLPSGITPSDPGMDDVTTETSETPSDSGSPESTRSEETVASLRLSTLDLLLLA